MNGGWIKLYRKFLDWEWFRVSEMVHLFIHLLLSANNEDGKWRGKVVKRGQVITGLKSLNEDTGISIQTIRTCLKRLKETGEINIQTTNRYSLITILKYDNYQDRQQTTNTPSNKQLTNNQQTTNNKQEDKEDKEDKEEYICPTKNVGQSVFDFSENGDDIAPKKTKGEGAPKKDKKKGASKKPSAKERDEEFTIYAKLLATIVDFKMNFKTPDSSITSWTKHFRLLHEKNGVDISRIRRALREYKNIIGQPYVPEIMCGSSFRDKFKKLENAIDRINNETKGISGKLKEPPYGKYEILEDGKRLEWDGIRGEYVLSKKEQQDSIKSRIPR